jgi:hypothetical protein
LEEPVIFDNVAIISLVDEDNEPLFEDLSWTVSFTFNNQCWDSFHSYRPAWMFNNRTDYYTTQRLLDGEVEYLWKHGTRDFGKFYDEVRDSILDVTFNNNPVNTKATNSFSFVSYAQDRANDHWVDLPFESFYKAFIYNGFQSSGILDVTVKNTNSNPFIEVDNDFENIRINNNEGTWSFSEFYDMTVDTSEPIWTHDTNNADYYFNRAAQGIIEWPNENRIDFNKSQFEMEAFRDKWVGVRLWYDNTPGTYKYVTQFGQTKNNISFK